MAKGTLPFYKDFDYRTDNEGELIALQLELEHSRQKILKLISHSVRNAAEIARLKAEIDTLKGEKEAEKKKRLRG